MPAASAMRASRRLSGHEPDQRSGTRVTARREEQFGPNRPIFSVLALYIAMRSRIEICGASTGGASSVWRGFFNAACWPSTALTLLPPPPSLSLPPPLSGGGGG